MEAGELAKGRGGAIARHRPHLGRKGEDLKLNRKGNIAGGNPKKSKSKKSTMNLENNNIIAQATKATKTSRYLYLRKMILMALLALLSVSVSAIFYIKFIR